MVTTKKTGKTAPVYADDSPLRMTRRTPLGERPANVPTTSALQKVRSAQAKREREEKEASIQAQQISASHLTSRPEGGPAPTSRGRRKTEPEKLLDYTSDVLKCSIAELAGREDGVDDREKASLAAMLWRKKRRDSVFAGKYTR